MLSIVIPVYNEEENLNSVIEELLENIDVKKIDNLLDNSWLLISFRV